MVDNKLDQPMLDADSVAKSRKHSAKSEGEELHGSALLKPGSFVAAVYTLSAISLGVGVFVLPGVIRDMGVVSGLLALVFCAFWSYWAQIQLLKASMQFNPPITSYEDLAEAAFGRAGKMALAFFTAFTLFVGNAAHMKTVVGLLHDLLEFYITGDYGQFPVSHAKELIMYIVLLGSILFLCIGDRMAALRYVSTISVSVVLSLCLWCTGECIFWYWPHGDYEFNNLLLASDNWEVYAKKLPDIIFTFTGAFCLFPVLHELENPSYSNIKRAVRWSTIICCAGYFFVSLIAILTFGKHLGIDPWTKKSNDNYVYMFFPNHYVVTILCFALTVAITLLYPVVNFPMLAAVEKFSQAFPAPTFFDFRRQFMEWRFRRLVLNVIAMILLVILNLQFSGLATLFGLCGAWGCGFVVIIIPSAIFLKVTKNGHWFERICAVLSILVMLTIIITFTKIGFFD